MIDPFMVAVLVGVLLIIFRSNLIPDFPVGYEGTLTFNGAVIFVKTWDFSFELDKVAYDTTSKTPSLGYYIKHKKPGLADGEVRVSGYWDNAAGQHLSGPTRNIRPGVYGTIIVTFDGSVGYSVYGWVVKMNPKLDATGTCDFDFDFTVEEFNELTNQT